MNHGHRLQHLITDHGYSVQYCADCEILHVDVGPVTLRLRPGALDALAEVLGRASVRLHHASPEADTARLPRTLAVN